MPSPIGHALAGLAVHAVSSSGISELRSPTRAAMVVGAALAADLDLLLRLVDGRNHHQMEMHSVGFALLAAAASGVLARSARLARPGALALAAGAAWLTHVLLDYVAVDTSPPIGLMILWPFSRAFFHFPWPIFLDIGRTLTWETFRHDILAAAWEVVLLLPVAGAALRFRTRASG